MTDNGPMNKTNLPTRLLDMVLPWIVQAFTLHAFGERVIYEINFAVMQLPQGVVPLLSLFSQIPGPQLGAPHIDIAQFPALGITEERCDNEVKGAMERMLGARSKALTAALAAGNGHVPGGQVGSKGLIIPGSTT